MARVGMRFKIRPGKVDEYVYHHAHVWPELLADISASGIKNYSIFLDGLTLFSFFEVDDFDASNAFLDKSEVNQRWSKFMQEFLAPPDDDPDAPTEVAVLPEIFRLD